MGKENSGSQSIDQQLSELQRKYKIMEGDKSKYSEESNNILRKQRNAIEKLKRDNEALREELAMESRHAKISSSLKASDEIARLQDQADNYTRKLEVEKRRLDELDKQIKIMEQKILEQRHRMGGVNAARDNNLQIQKQIRILENRLDKALVKFNEALAHNKQLRETIDNLRRERVVFDNIYKKLERELHEKKKEMANIIEISNIAYEARDQAQNEMAALKAQADKEQAAFEQEWKELGKLIEQDRKMKDFMKLTEKRGAGEAARGDMGLDEENKLRKKVIKGNWGIAKDKAAQQVSLEKVQSYEEAFAKIQAATGISDIDDLVTTFINAEDQNFSLFNYVNELNQEIEKLEEQIAEIKGEIERYKGQGLTTDNQRKKILKELEEKLQTTEAKAEQYDLKYGQAMKTVNALKHGIWNIFSKIGCNTPEVREMLGNQGVTESNMMQYLGIIEQRTNQILQLYAAQQQEEVDTSVTVLGQGPATPAGATQLQIQPPTTGDDFDSDNEDDSEEDEGRPLQREELKQRAWRNLNKDKVTTKANVRSKAAGGKKESKRAR
eukprot:Rmarinus@m.17933